MSGVDKLKNFWEELKKRNVVRALIFYSVIAWVLIQFAATTFPFLNLPKWATTAVIVTLLAGAPIVAIVSWIYELTKDGLKKTDEVPTEVSIKTETGKRLNRGIIAVLSIAVVFLLVDKFYLSSTDSSEVQRTESIAIFPFSIQGGEEIQYLREGMVDLISTKLDGIPGMNATDPNILLAQLGESSVNYRDPISAATIANDLGANRLVLGSITAIGERLQVKISKYNESGQAIGNSIVEEGTAAELYAQVDEIIRKLVADELAELGEEMDSEAVLMTNNVESIIPFLEGEQLRREGKFREALASFKRSITIDSSFAIGHLKYIEAAGWVPEARLFRRDTEYLPYLSRMNRLKSTLEGKSRELADASLAYVTGDIGSIELYKRLLEKYGESREILIGLAESLFHFNSIAGNDRSESKPYFERILEIDPTNNEYLIHLYQMAAFNGDLERLATLANRFDSTASSKYSALYQTLILKDSVSDDELLEWSKLAVSNYNFRSDNGVRAPESLELMKRLMDLEPRFKVGVPFYEMIHDLLYGNHSAFISPRLEKAIMEKEGDTNLDLLLFQSGYTGAPILDPYLEELRAYCQQQIAFAQQNGLPDLPPEYGLAMVNIMQGNLDEAEVNLDKFVAYFDFMDPSGTTETSGLSKMAYYNIKGMTAFNRGQLDEAMLLFDSAVVEAKGVPIAFASLAALSRQFYQVEYYIKKENYETALMMLKQSLNVSDFGTYQTNLPSGPNWGYIIYRMASVYELMDNDEMAISFYRRFTEIYANADEVYDQMLSEAYNRLSSLVGVPESQLRGEIKGTDQ